MKEGLLCLCSARSRRWIIELSVPFEAYGEDGGVRYSQSVRRSFRGRVIYPELLKFSLAMDSIGLRMVFMG